MMTSHTFQLSDKQIVAANQVINMTRCQQILECKRQIDYWTSRLKVLEAEQADHITLAKLRLDAKSAWNTLSRSQKREKRYILAALESKELPDELDDFPNSDFPPAIRMDKDILLARVARSDFTRKYKDERLFIPPKLRGDKEVILKIIPNHPAVVESMSCNLRDDVEIFQALLSNKYLPSQVLQHFSDRIRSNPQLMLQLSSHRDGLFSMAFVSHSLRNDKIFILNVIKTGYQHHPLHSCPIKAGEGSSRDSHQILRSVSQRLRDDREVVLAAVQKCGLNLKYASYNLRKDKEIVLTAAKQNSDSFRYCLPSDTKEDLLRDREFVVKHLLKSSCDNVLRVCAEHYPSDRDIILSSLEQGMEWTHVPLQMEIDRAFALEAVQRNPRSYQKMSDTLCSDIEIARAVVQFNAVEAEIILDATERCPSLLSDRDAMLSIAKAWWADTLEETLQFSPIEIRSDKEIMLAAVENNVTAFDYCSEELESDRDIILATVEGSSSCLFLVVGEEFQVENPDIVIRAIENTDPDDLWDIYDDICDEVFTNRDVALAWLKKGGGWLMDEFGEFEDDEELILTLARENVAEFDNASVTLRKNKSFMLKAVALDARTILGAEDDLRHDYDLLLQAFSTDQQILRYYSEEDEFEFMVTFTEKVRNQIEDYDTFTNVVMTTIKQHPVELSKSDCSLSLLNQGLETTRSYTGLIAAFIGIPSEEEIIKLRSASTNLLQWGF